MGEGEGGVRVGVGVGDYLYTEVVRMEYQGTMHKGGLSIGGGGGGISMSLYGIQ